MSPSAVHNRPQAAAMSLTRRGALAPDGGCVDRETPLGPAAHLTTRRPRPRRTRHDRSCELRGRRVLDCPVASGAARHRREQPATGGPCTPPHPFERAFPTWLDSRSAMLPLPASRTIGSLETPSAACDGLMRPR
eukprot:929951-Prymnesium_polylepis.1